MPRRKNISARLRKRNMELSKSPAATRKGMELPINTLVIVAIAVIVILAIAAFFMGGFGGSSKDMQNRQAFLNVCGPWVQTGCNNMDYDSSIEQAFIVWQPNVDLGETPTGQSKIDYLASKCGCFGAGSGGRSATCSSYADKASCINQNNCAWWISKSKCEILTYAVANTCQGVETSGGTKGNQGFCKEHDDCSGATPAKVNKGQLDCPVDKPECCAN